MGLTNIVGALLPRDYREQVLGDLHERGFRLLDIASVVPQVWWSYLRRAGSLPRFALATASDAQLHQRTEQFLRRSSWVPVAWIWTQGQRVVHWIDGPLAVDLAVEVILLAILLMVRSASLRRLETLAQADRPSWVEFHLRQLNRYRIWARFGIPYLVFPLGWISLSKLFSDTRTSTERTWWIAMIILSIILGQLRARRLGREIKGLQ